MFLRGAASHVPDHLGGALRLRVLRTGSPPLYGYLGSGAGIRQVESSTEPKGSLP